MPPNQQVNWRIGEDSMRRVEQLRERRGAASEAAILREAIDRLFEREHRLMHEELAVHQKPSICPWCGIDQGEEGGGK